MYRLLIPDKTFRNLNIPISPARQRELEKQVRKGNIIDPIPVWNSHILMGYEQYDLCEKYHRQYPITDLFFSRKHDAMDWVCRQQLLRKDLGRPAIYWLFYQMYRARNETEKQKAAREQFQYKKLSPSYRSEMVDTEETDNIGLMIAIGQEYGYHKQTIRNYVHFGRQLDQLDEMYPGLRLRVVKGEVEIPLMFMDALMQMPKDQLDRMVNDPNCRRLVPSEETQARIRTARDPRYRARVHVDTAIKETPAYDPDAELNGMSLTIGAWVKAISRTEKKADLQHATPEGKARLRQALEQLKMETESLYRTLEAENHE